MGAHEQTGVAGCFSLDEYDSGRHQEARDRPGATRRTTARGTCWSCGAQTGPVFLTYPRDRRRSTRSCSTARRRRRRCSISSRPTACSTSSGRFARGDATARRTRSAPCRRSTSPTATIAPRARRARAEQLGRDRRTRGEWDTFLAVAFPGQPGADPALQPGRQGPGGAYAGRRCLPRCASSSP